MTKQIGEFDLITNQMVLRNMTEEELAKFNAELEAESLRLEQAEIKKLAEEAEAQAKAQAKAALLDRLGITADEAKLLLS